VSDKPDVLELEVGKEAYWTVEIADTFRPTARVETGDNQTSLYSYLDALEGSLTLFADRVGPLNQGADFAKQIYHSPFPGMTRQAHRTFMEVCGVYDREQIAASYDAKVRPTVHFARRIGSAYGASNVVCLAGLIQSAGETLAPGDRLSLFAYGSGCQGEFYTARLGPRFLQEVRDREIEARLDERARVSVGQYERLEYSRERALDRADFRPRRDVPPGVFRDLYEGRRLLVLDQVKDYRREYVWS
jgi:hydroxymethylglutaryl-CoA synthase